MERVGWLTLIFCDAVTKTQAALLYNITIMVELVGRDWLQQLCLLNIADCTKDARNIYFILFHVNISAAPN